MHPKILPIRDGVTFMRLVRSKDLRLPLFASRLHAGFPSPADDYVEEKIDLNRYLVQHPAATFPVRVDGDSMTGAGIFRGDIGIVDRSLEDALLSAGLPSSLPAPVLPPTKCFSEADWIRRGRPVSLNLLP